LTALTSLLMLFKEDNKLFGSIMQSLHDYTNLKEKLGGILLTGEQHPSDLDLPGALGVTLGFLKQHPMECRCFQLCFERFICCLFADLASLRLIKSIHCWEHGSDGFGDGGILKGNDQVYADADISSLKSMVFRTS
jgi:hypothetical protein